jgi:signal peptidase II
VAWIVAAVILLLDQATKALVMIFLDPGQSVPLIPRVLHLTYVQNTGAAFGLFKGAQWLFIGVSWLVIGYLGWRFWRAAMAPAVVVWGEALVLGGAAGNLLDRLRLGSVVDFLDVRIWPVFNVGDSAISIGVVLLVWHSITAQSLIDADQHADRR